MKAVIILIVAVVYLIIGAMIGILTYLRPFLDDSEDKGSEAEFSVIVMLIVVLFWPVLMAVVLLKLSIALGRELSKPIVLCDYGEDEEDDNEDEEDEAHERA